ncbi:5-methyltetrahydropteroyltriglutamate--homocysteine S-methyltransferase [Allokutzneria sp. A3M-2-11 16]|uniref:5-methyltetrahydropteroyltriglutamate-- homocysteine S-methyltransferase n=1 Tax=Allokutzneria sp. A3M-2-11 16 TaxID=2962043 RepID=UPI0020B8FB3C|nr:5-methyltetrahydropteroyltriglutamate--homocysteine S-methyltransferase [Allokutzneria sp. A3M-2-11 16]MCP3803034.1 5-methyltetrahydropteroyltriglutamate--homocysteine S-methyltransferase [Allokutzneria sp. A3M-2-11 16]
MNVGSTVLGYPRIGPRRELKRALEDYWAGRSSVGTLESVAAELRARTWAELAASGLDSLPGNTFSYYDQVLDTAVMLGAVPARYRELGLSDVDTYFAMARGNDVVPPLEMTKWFDTNYHYLVPELGPDTVFSVADDKPLREYREALALGVTTRPVVLGPVTFLLLSKASREGFAPLSLLDSLLDAYERLLASLADAGVEWVQLDEPAFCADRSPVELAALSAAYDRLGRLSNRPKVLVASYFGSLGAALPVLAESAVEAIAVDLVAGGLDGIASVTALRDKTVVAGVVDGRNVWRTDLSGALAKCATLLGSAKRVEVSTSCSLLHVPYDVEAEPDLDPDVRARLAFARQKLAEVVLLGRVLREGAEVIGEVPEVSPRPRDARVRARLEALRPEHSRRADYATRAKAQQERLELPPLATTTIGSFPQTGAIRQARADFRAGRLGPNEYRRLMRAEIERVVRLQESIGLDVLVHGEPERNDMVQYFAELLEGFAATEFGWVQSYGSRCVRPPILFGDVSRPEPMTVEWAAYAQSRSHRPVKGMLTGPTTILAWSFVRDDQPLGVTARQVALALRDEVRDLEAAGIGVVQVDEPALRELLPLRERDRAGYLAWALESFRLATAGAAESTQIHTHLCYSEFGDVISAIDGLDADVTTIEAARSKMEVLGDLRAVGFGRGVGPGVYDIHSPRVPGEDEIVESLRAAVRVIPAERLWVNPDCGLKTRGYAEVESALRHMVAAARKVRARL